MVIALIVTPDGLPLACEVMPGNTSDRTTLKGFLARIESLYGKEGRVWVMDRGIPTEEVLREMRAEGVHYLVGAPKGQLGKLEPASSDRPWMAVDAGLQVKRLEREGEVYGVARSEDRRQKERAIRRRRLKRLVQGLNALKRRPGSRDVLLQRVEALGAEVGQVGQFVRIRCRRRARR